MSGDDSFLLKDRRAKVIAIQRCEWCKKTKGGREQKGGERRRALNLDLLSQTFFVLFKPDLKILALLEVGHCHHVPLVVVDGVELD